MMENSRHIIDPKTIQDVKAFEWIAKKLANGFLHGKHYSSRLGAGMEFQQYRPYVSGDDVRGIDWKMYAKTDKFYIKETSILTEHKYFFLIDNSDSMKYTEDGWSKFMYSKLCCAAIMTVLMNQGDHFGWQSGTKMMPTGSGSRHWQHCIETLYLLDFEKADGVFIPPNYKFSTLIWISDFYTSISEIKNRIKSFKTPNSELILFQILGDAEKKLDFGSNTTFVDLETHERLDVNSNKARKEYQHKLALHLSKIKNLCYEYQGVYQEVSLNESVSETLRHFFYNYQIVAS